MPYLSSEFRNLRHAISSDNAKLTFYIHKAHICNSLCTTIKSLPRLNKGVLSYLILMIIKIIIAMKMTKIMTICIMKDTFYIKQFGLVSNLEVL